MLHFAIGMCHIVLTSHHYFSISWIAHSSISLILPKGYKLFYKYTVPGNGRLNKASAQLLFAHEMQMTYGHDGGALITVPDGRILFAVGDCLPYGLNGLFASQDPHSHCGKILLIDPDEPGSYEVAAAGVRNSQQMFLEGDMVYFMDIGGVTAEEFNAVPLADVSCCISYMSITSGLVES